MDPLGDEFLAGARFTLNQHGAVHRRHLLDLDEHFLNRGALTEDPGASLQVAPLSKATHGGNEVVGPHRLDEHLGGPEPDGALGAFGIGRLEECQDRDLVITGVRRQCHRRCLVDGASQHQQQRVIAADGGAALVGRRRDIVGQPRGLECLGERDGSLKISEGDDDLG